MEKPYYNGWFWGYPYFLENTHMIVWIEMCLKMLEDLFLLGKSYGRDHGS